VRLGVSSWEVYWAFWGVVRDCGELDYGVGYVLYFDILISLGFDVCLPSSCEEN